MNEITVNGGIPLYGKITPCGSKNAALPIIFASMSVYGVSTVDNVPDIGDVRVAIAIIESFGAKVLRMGHTLYIDTASLHYEEPDPALTGKIRASSYLIGSCLSRFGKFHLPAFGGCDFCNRPIDMHLYSARMLGASQSGDLITLEHPRGDEIVFEKRSVGATVNALIIAASAEGESEIFGYANEPHVRNVIEYLRAAGALIGVLPDRLIVRGSELKGAYVRVIPDMIEAGTYLLLGPLTGGEVSVEGARWLELDGFIEPILESGIEAVSSADCVALCGEAERKIRITTAPHPGFPTDLQPQCAPLMAKFSGGEIYERVWESRFSYLKALGEFGLKYNIKGQNAEIYRSGIAPAVTTAPDLRGGAAALMCALSARGVSKIKGTERILRGYSDIWNKLRALGAEINEN